MSVIITMKLTNKMPTGCNDIDMITVRKVIMGIAKPLSHICYLSLQSDKFPHEMKIPKFIPLLKSTNTFTN